MDKINFENLPSTNTPVSAENLNKIQDNVERALNGTILYEDEKGTAEAITLNTEIENFSYFEVESYVYFSEDKVYASTGKLPIKAKGRVHLNNIFVGADADLKVNCKRIAINGTSVTIRSDRLYSSAYGSAEDVDGTFTYITKITGYY